MDVITAEFWENVQVILSVLALGVFTTTIVYYGAKGRQFIKDKQVQQIVKQVVLYVEQVYGSESGQLKKQIAIEVAQEYLDNAGIKLDVNYLATLIESVVFDELNRWKFDDANIQFTVGGEIDPDTVQLELE